MYKEMSQVLSGLLISLLLLVSWPVIGQVLMNNSQCLAFAQAAQYAKAIEACKVTADQDPLSAYTYGFALLNERIGTQRIPALMAYGLASAKPAERKQFKEALRYLKAGAEAGIPHSQYIYAVLLRVPQNKGDQKSGSYAMQEAERQSEFWLKMAAAKDHLEANAVLGAKSVIDDPEIGVVKRDTRYLKYMEKAAALGDPVSKNRLAQLQTRDKKAADGDPLAQRQLGLSLLSSEPDKALSWLEKSANGGDIVAARTLGQYYWKTEPVKSKAFYSKAAKAEDVDSLMALGNLAACAKDKAAAASYFNQAASSGNPQALLLKSRLDEGVEKWPGCP